MMNEQYLDVSLKASFYTQNELTEKTKRIWLVFHGYGQLSRYLIRKFKGLDPEGNYIIAPQGLSKFYLEGFSGRVGASWMTKEDRLTDIENQFRYVDAVLDQHQIDWEKHQLVYFGFSQGVATMCRYAAHSKLPFQKMILWAGTFPPDLERSDFGFLTGNEKASYYTGFQDPFFKPGMKEEQLSRIQNAMALEANVIEFEGKHEVLADLVQKI